MNKKNKLLPIILSVVMIFSVFLAACNKDPGTDAGLTITSDKNPTVYLGQTYDLIVDYPDGYDFTATITAETRSIAQIRILDETKKKFRITPTIAGDAVVELKNGTTLLETLTIKCRMPQVTEYEYLSELKYFNITNDETCSFQINYPESFNVTVAVTEGTSNIAKVEVEDALNKIYKVTPLRSGTCEIEVKNGSDLLDTITVSISATAFVVLSEKNPTISIDERYTLAVDFPDYIDEVPFTFDMPSATSATQDNAQIQSVPGSNNKQFYIIPLAKGSFIIELKSGGELLETVTVTIKGLTYPKVAEFELNSENDSSVSYVDGYLLRMNYPDSMDDIYIDPLSVNFNKVSFITLDEITDPLKTVRIMPVPASDSETRIECTLYIVNGYSRVATVNITFIMYVDQYGRNILNYETPAEGITVDGVMTPEKAAIYTKLSPKYGVEGQISLSYYIGTQGLYFFFDVEDNTCYKGNRAITGYYTENYIRETDRIELFMDTLYDKGSAPKTDDYSIRVTAEGEYLIYKGNGSGWSAEWPLGLDAVATTLKPEGLTAHTTVTERNPYHTGPLPGSATDIDAGYTVEFFMSYSNFGFTAGQEVGLTIGQADMWSIDEAQRYVSTGSIAAPDEFLTLSEYGFGTNVAIDLDVDINGIKPAYFTPENAASDPRLYYFSATRNWGQTPGKVMTVTTYVYCGVNGLQIFMFAESTYLKYYYSDGFSFYSDHVEIRIDTLNNEAHDLADIFFFSDILGTSQTGYGINNANRVSTAIDLVFTTAYTGELKDAQDRPIRNSGSTDPKTFTFQAFFPWYSINVPAGGTFGMFMCCGNPDEGASGIGNVFYESATYADYSMWHAFEVYKNYTKFVRPE